MQYNKERTLSRHILRTAAMKYTVTRPERLWAVTTAEIS